ncbi:MAG: hypothetical protein ACPLSM_01475 [Thermosphaera sp.]
MRVTGFKPLDELVSPVEKHWSIEFYGDPSILFPLIHYTVASRSSSNRVYLVHNVEFGGLHTPLLVRLCRMFECRMDNIMVSRSFRLNDTVKILEDLAAEKDSVVVLVFPYNYLPSDPSKYSEATRITGLLSRISVFNQVVIFNTVSRYGYFMPEGGSMHHHAVKIIVRVVRRNGRVVSQIVKHPVKNEGVRVFSERLLEAGVVARGSRSLLAWIRS